MAVYGGGMLPWRVRFFNPTHKRLVKMSTFEEQLN
jgi:hypothetical protein